MMGKWILLIRSSGTGCCSGWRGHSWKNRKGKGAHVSITETMDIIVADSPGWIRHALCGSGDYDYDLWFPEPSERHKAAAAVRVCRRCPVRGQCLTDALEREDIRGIRGGVSGNRRSRMLRKNGNRSDRV